MLSCARLWVRNVRSKVQGVVAGGSFRSRLLTFHGVRLQEGERRLDQLR